MNKIIRKSNLYIVPGSCGDTYHVIYDTISGVASCVNNSKSEFCKSFQYKRDCKHLLAVRMLDMGEVV